MAEEKIIKEELKRTKEDLEDLEMYIQEFSAFLPLAVCTVNPVEIIIDVNQSFQDLTHYNAVEIVSSPVIDIFLEKQKLENLLRKVQRKGLVRDEKFTLLSKEKKEIPVSISVSARKDEEENFVGYFIGLTDIAELKKFREGLEGKVRERTKELEESRAALMNMLEDVEEARGKAEEEKNKTLAIITNFADGLLVFDREGKLSLINPQAEHFFDVKSRDIIGRSIFELSAFPTLTLLISLIGEEIKGVFRKELSIKERMTLEISTIPMISGEERLGALVILHDITREKKIEQIKTEFVSLAAHQLRTPLSAIKWTIKMILDGDLGPTTTEQREFLEKTYNSNERMISLINDLLDVTRIEEGRYLFKPILTDFEPIVQFVVNFYQEEIERRGIKFQFEKPEKKLPQVQVDVEKIKLAIQNIIENAVKYTPPGGEIKVLLKHNGKEIEFQARDSGVGIPKDQQDRVFSKFFRASNVMRMETEGSGLGLFITKNIIEAHGGRIWFESEEGKGTTFYFSLPVGEEFAEFLKEF